MPSGIVAGEPGGEGVLHDKPSELADDERLELPRVDFREGIGRLDMDILPRCGFC